MWGKHPGFGLRQITFDANSAVARALFDWLVNLGPRGLDEERISRPFSP